MAHEHSHGEPGGNYFLDQLFTVVACGAVGLVAVLMYQTGFLGRILVPMFFVPVLVAGVAVLLLVAVRAVALWKMVGSRPAITPDHEGHTEECGHDHGHDHAHSHSHSHAHSHAAAEPEAAHDHGWAPWKYMILALPVFIFFLGLPRPGLLGTELRGLSGDLQVSKRQTLSPLVGGVAHTHALKKTEQLTHFLPFQELTQAAAIPSRHHIFEDDIGVLRGQFIPLKGGSNDFTLLRVDTTCCVADSVFLETRIVPPERITHVKPEEWVQVRGVITFQKNAKGKWIPVITLSSVDDVQTGIDPVTNVNSF